MERVYPYIDRLSVVFTVSGVDLNLQTCGLCASACAQNSWLTHGLYQFYVLYLAWWWLNEPKHVAEFLIVNIDYQHMFCLLTDKIAIQTERSSNVFW